MTALYVPGVEETDTKKLIRSQQLVASQTSTNTTGIATNTAGIATNTTNIASNTSAITALQTAGSGLVNSSGSLAVALSKITASLGSDTAISNSVYTDGPSIAQGTSGTWFASGTVTFVDTAAATQILCKLWDGTTVIASASVATPAANFTDSVSLSGVLATPAANLRISCKSTAAGATSTFKFNSSSNSKDCTITAYRIA